jgi:signal transduction histidine kinase
LERLAVEEFHCIVSDYDMPGQNGIKFLQAVRQEYPNLPFILYTGKGSEEIASKAISAGVTDYLQKKSNTEQFVLLANRIITSVNGYLAQKEADWQKRILENMGEGVYVLDDSYTLQYVNFRVSDMDTVSEENWTGRHISYFEETEFLSSAEVDRITDGIDHLFAGQATDIRIEVEPALPKSVDVLSLRLTLIQSTAADDFVLATSRDITDRKEREQQLQTLTQQYETLVENFPNGAVYLINPDLEYVRARGEQLQSIGLSPGQIEGETPHDAFPEEIADELCDRYHRAFDGESSTFKQTYRGERYRIRVVPVSNKDESIPRIIAVSQNITEFAQKKEQLERQNARLEKFANIVSHDLRNPLDVAGSRLELAERDCNSEHLSHVDTALSRMNRIIEDVLWLAREGRDIRSTEPVELETAVDEAWNLVADSSERTELRYATNESRLPTICADPSRLSQLLENLLQNAIEHGGDDVTVTVGALGDGFYIEDDGPGIPEESRDNVFETGYSTSEHGTGFGLSIVKQVAQAHGWDIHVTAGSAGGARFDITNVEFSGK